MSTAAVSFYDDHDPAAPVFYRAGADVPDEVAVRVGSHVLNGATAEEPAIPAVPAEVQDETGAPGGEADAEVPDATAFEDHSPSA